MRSNESILREFNGAGVRNGATPEDYHKSYYDEDDEEEQEED